VVSFLLSVTFACGLLIATAHVLNRRFIAPVYDVAANLTAFGCAVAASLLLGHWIPALLSAIATVCWLALARRTMLSRKSRLRRTGFLLIGSDTGQEHFHRQQVMSTTRSHETRP
jgi:hypothetical protein